MAFTIVTTDAGEPHLGRLRELEAEGCRLVTLPRGARWDEALIASVAPVADAYVGVFRGIGLPGEVIARSPRLRGIVSPIIGVENIDVAAAGAHDVIVAHGATPENFDGMAEAGVMLIAALLKALPQKEAVLAAGQWRPTPLGRMVHGSTVGIIGLGRIGRGIARRLEGWGARVVAADPYVAPGTVPDVDMMPLDDLLRQADAVVVVVTLTDETRHIIDRRAIGLMKQGACLINIGRGGTVDDLALLDALEAGHLSGAALDAWETEPVPADSRLRGHPNVIATGHCIGHSQELYDRAPAATIDNVRAILAGEAPPYIRNPDVLPRWRARIAALA